MFQGKSIKNTGYACPSFTSVKRPSFVDFSVCPTKCRKKIGRQCAPNHVSLNSCQKAAQLPTPLGNINFNANYQSPKSILAVLLKSPISKTTAAHLRSFVRNSKNVKTRTHEHLQSKKWWLCTKKVQAFSVLRYTISVTVRSSLSNAYKILSPSPSPRLLCNNGCCDLAA